jgi:hypothetical protein
LGGTAAGRRLGRGALAHLLSPFSFHPFAFLGLLFPLSFHCFPFLSPIFFFFFSPSLFLLSLCASFFLFPSLPLPFSSCLFFPFLPLLSFPCLSSPSLFFSLFKCCFPSLACSFRGLLVSLVLFAFFLLFQVSLLFFALGEEV